MRRRPRRRPPCRRRPCRRPGIATAPPRSHAPRRARPGRALLVAAACVLALSPLAARLAGAASALRVPPIEDYGEVEAATWNEDGEQVGPASMRLERLADGRVRVEATSGFAKAPRTVV